MGSVSASLRKAQHVKRNWNHTVSASEWPNRNAFCTARALRFAPLRTDGNRCPLDKENTLLRGSGRDPAVQATVRFCKNDVRSPSKLQAASRSLPQ
jgi:hypothetical protein